MLKVEDKEMTGKVTKW